MGRVGEATTPIHPHGGGGVPHVMVYGRISTSCLTKHSYESLSQSVAVPLASRGQMYVIFLLQDASVFGHASRTLTCCYCCSLPFSPLLSSTLRLSVGAHALPGSVRDKCRNICQGRCGHHARQRQHGRL